MDTTLLILSNKKTPSPAERELFPKKQAPISREFLINNLGDKAVFRFSEEKRSLEAVVATHDGRELVVGPEGRSIDLGKIKSKRAFESYFKDCFIKASVTSDGNYQLNVLQRGRGGAQPDGVAPRVLSEEEKSDIASQALPLIHEGQEKINELVIRENVNLFVGRTRAGKSLVCNLINSVTLSSIPGENGQLNFDASNPLMPISHSSRISCTKFPNVYNPYGKNYSDLDCPGFGDTEGPAQDIANAFYRAEIAKKINKMKMILVVDYGDLITGGGLLFRQTLSDLVNFFDAAQTEEGCEKLAASLCLVMTKVTPQTLGDLVEKIKKWTEKVGKARTKKDNIPEKIRDQEAKIAKLVDKDKIKKLNKKIKKLNKSATKAVKKIAELEKKIKLGEQTLMSRKDPAEEVRAGLREFLRDDDILSQKAKSILRRVLEKDQLTIFSKPTQVEEGAKQVERDQIIQLINRMPYLESTTAKPQAKIPEGYIGIIQNAIQVQLHHLKYSFSNRILEELESALKVLYKTASSEEALQKLEKKLKQLLAEKKTASLLEFVQQINGRIGLGSKIVDEGGKQQEVLKFLVSLLAVDEQRKWPSSRIWLDEFTNVTEHLKSWRDTFKEITNEKVEPEQQGDKIILRSYFPKMSQVKAKLLQSAGIKNIEIHGLHTVTIDEDLTVDDPLLRDKLSGVNLSIIAPRWAVKVGAGLKRHINLSGTNGADSNEKAQNGQGATEPPQGGARRPGGNGADGDSGNEGLSGGHFLGVFGMKKMDLSSLQITSNGGKGGKGQKGGNGGPGLHGRDADPKYNKDGWDFNGEVAWFKCDQLIGHHMTSDQEKKNYGIKGTQGGAGGRGGIGGEGGKKGSITLIPLSGAQHGITTQNDPGDPGDPGKPGKASQHQGLIGRDFSGVWHTGDPGDGWNGQPRFVTNEITYTPLAVTPGGTSGVQKTSSAVPFDLNEHLFDYKYYLLSQTNPIVREVLQAFYLQCEGHQAIRDKGNVFSFLKEFYRIEELFAKEGGTPVFNPLYESLIDRIYHYADQMNPADVEGIKVLQYLYTSALSRVRQIKAAGEPRLIIDIRTFLTVVEGNVNKLRRAERAFLIDQYKQDYQQQIDNKIAEAKSFIDQLSLKLKAEGEKIDRQIDAFLQEITKMKNAAQQNIAQLREAERQLEEAMKKKLIFGVLTIVAQGVGCCFGPVGAIAATVVTAGLEIAKDPSTWAKNVETIIGETGKLVELLEKKPDEKKVDQAAAKGSAFSKLKGDLKAGIDKARPVVEEALRLKKDLDNDQGKLEAVRKSIHEAEQAINALYLYHTKVAESFGPSLHELENEVMALQAGLQSQSLVAMTYYQPETKKFFAGIVSTIKKFTEGFSAGDGIVEIFQGMEEAIDTSMKLYVHIDDYKEKRLLAAYLARLAAPEVQSVRVANLEYQKAITDLDCIIQRNIVLEQYCRAVSTVQQWAFPFAAIFLDDFRNLKPFLQLESAKQEDFMNAVLTKLTSLAPKLKTYDSEINATIDQALYSGNFRTPPFQTWSCRTHPTEIRQLMDGEMVTLSADVHGSPNRRSAIKFSEIAIEMRFSSEGDPVKKQDREERLKRALDGLRVELIHSGNSYYRFDGNIFYIPSGGQFHLSYAYTEGGKPPAYFNEAYRKMKDGDFLLSPYASWQIQFTSEKQEAVKPAEFFSEEELDQLEIQLVGKGSWVDERLMKKRIEELCLPRLYMGKGASFRAFAPMLSKPEVKETGLDTAANAFNQKDRGTYWYHALDIHNIQSWLFRDENHVNVIEPIGRGQLNRVKIQAILDIVDKENKPVLCVFNIENVHWVAFCLVKTGNDLVLLYKDSMGSSNSNLRALFEANTKDTVVWKHHSGVEQVRDSSSCGILALDNLKIMVDALKKDPSGAALIRDFEQLPFCTMAEATALRKGEFASAYVLGTRSKMQVEANNAEKRRLIREHHHSEIEAVSAIIRRHYNQSVRCLKGNETLDRRLEPSTIGVEIGVRSFKGDQAPYRYHYRICCPSQMTPAALKNLLINFECFDLAEDRYAIVEGSIEIESEFSDALRIQRSNQIPVNGVHVDVPIEELFENLHLENNVQKDAVRHLAR